MSEEIQGQQEEGGLSTGTQVAIAAFFLGLPFLGMAAEALSLGEPGLVLAAVGAGSIGLGSKALIDRNRKHCSDRPQDDLEEQDKHQVPLIPHLSLLDRLQQANWRALLEPVDTSGTDGYLPKDGIQTQEGSAVVDGPDTEPLSTVDSLFVTNKAQEAKNVIRRLTIDEICKHITPDSYRIYIGRSLTSANNHAVSINIYKRHFKFIGASQKGKSSMAAAFLEIVTRTHSPKKVQIAILDLENQTGNLFANKPHVFLHARSREEVIEALNKIVAFVDYRYEKAKSEVIAGPILIVYVEEFLALKNWLRKKINSAPNEEAKKQALKMYSDFVYAISEIASRGLKCRVQLLLCAQVDYRDNDKELQEALINVESGMSFCVRPTAAQAAGFSNNELLARNYKDDVVGQAVVEMTDCKDLVLAPDFDLEQKLLELEDSQRTDAYASFERSLRSDGEPAHSDSDARTAPSGEPNLTLVRALVEQDEYAHKNGVRQPGEPAHTTQNDAYPRLNATQIAIFTQAYEMTGNIDKSLSFAKADTRYREHARVIIRELGLKKREA